MLLGRERPAVDSKVGFVEPLDLGRDREEHVTLPHTKFLLPVLSRKASPR